MAWQFCDDFINISRCLKRLCVRQTFLSGVKLLILECTLISLCDNNTIVNVWISQTIFAFTQVTPGNKMWNGHTFMSCLSDMNGYRLPVFFPVFRTVLMTWIDGNFSEAMKRIYQKKDTEFLSRIILNYIWQSFGFERFSNHNKCKTRN